MSTLHPYGSVPSYFLEEQRPETARGERRGRPRVWPSPGPAAHPAPRAGRAAGRARSATGPCEALSLRLGVAEGTAPWESSWRQQGRTSDRGAGPARAPAASRGRGCSRARPGLREVGAPASKTGTQRPALCGRTRGPKRSQHRSGSWRADSGSGRLESGLGPGTDRARPGGSLRQRPARLPGLHFPVSRLPLVGSWSGGISLFCGVGRKKGRGHPFSLMLPGTSCRLWSWSGPRPGLVVTSRETPSSSAGHAAPSSRKPPVRLP